MTRRITREEFERRNQNACPEVLTDNATAFAEIDIDKPATHGQQAVALSTLAELLGIIQPPADPWRAA